MPMSCSVLGCPSRYSNEKNIKFFHFPIKNKCQLTAWLNAMKRRDWIPSKHDRICNKHFTVDDYLYRPDTHYIHLKSTAIPSIFPSFIKSNKINHCKIMKIDNENKEKEISNVEENSKSHERNFTNIETEINNTKQQGICDSHINIQSEDDGNIENVHSTVDVVKESNIYNANDNINLKTYDQETTATGETCATVSSTYKPINIEENQVKNHNNSDCDNLDYNNSDYDSSDYDNTDDDSSELHCIKNSSLEINLRHKVNILQQKLRRREAKIIYLQRVLTNLKEKKYILSTLQHV